MTQWKIWQVNNWCTLVIFPCTALFWRRQSCFYLVQFRYIYKTFKRTSCWEHTHWFFFFFLQADISLWPHFYSRAQSSAPRASIELRLTAAVRHLAGSVSEQTTSDKAETSHEFDILLDTEGNQPRGVRHLILIASANWYFMIFLSCFYSLIFLYAQNCFIKMSDYWDWISPEIKKKVHSQIAC